MSTHRERYTEHRLPPMVRTAERPREPGRVLVWNGSRYIELDPTRAEDSPRLRGSLTEPRRQHAAGVAASAEQRSAPAEPSAPVKSYDGINALSQLARDLGDLGLLTAVQGDDDDYRQAAGIIRTAVEVHGPVYAAEELQRIALGLTPGDQLLAGNLTRAGTMLETTTALPTRRRRR